MTRVIKVGGRAQRDPQLAAVLAEAWRRDHSVCLVHGGGDEVSALQRQLGREPTFLQGRRVTTDEDLILVRMVLSGSVNKRLVAKCLAVGLPAAGVSGEDAYLIGCSPFAGGAYGAVGEPVEVDPTLLRVLIAGGILPVVSPLGRFVLDGRACNVNGDDAAAAIAAALGAEELLLVADVDGVRQEDGTCISHLDRISASDLIRQGTARDGMIAKLQAAARALEGGVRTVRIGSLAAIVDATAGTTIVNPTAGAQAG